ncbi:MAG: hypothetical protein V3V28_12780 [Polaribacter sp.]|uniref:hypothetical protein n=1 Tax=Polaribacter sp. TaxID=1920175 RepID=UPI002F35B457
MKRVFLIVLTFLMFYNITGQNNKAKLDTISKYDYWNYGMTFSVQVGVWIPLGNLKKTFNLNPSIGFKIGVPIAKNLRIEGGTIINVPLKSEVFEYFDKDKSFFTKSKNTVNGTLGVWLKHENIFNEKYFLDKYFGIGVGFIQTDEKKINSKNENDQWYGVESVNFNFGLEIRKIAFIKRSIGIFIEYNFTPYTIFKNVSNDFGNSSISTGLSYRF